MYRPQLPTGSNRRRGVILLVVITLLTLFAVVGLTFVLYAESKANSSRIFREANDLREVDYLTYLQTEYIDGTAAQFLFSYGLGEIIYDAPDDASGVYNSVRGHALARLMYGWNDDFVSTLGTNNPQPNPNRIPFNGTGRVHTGGTAGTPMNPFSTDDYSLVNYTFFQNGYGGTPFLRDPERLYPNAANGTFYRTDPAQPKGPFTGGANVPWTYPDLDNMFLATVGTVYDTQGTVNNGQPYQAVLLPSFHRQWTGFGHLGPDNPNWTNTGAQYKYMTLRPRPAPGEHPNFPLPVDDGGDVKNLTGAPAAPPIAPGRAVRNMDSIWIDLQHPVMKFPDGKKYKPLFAFLVRDLDGLVNINVHGNLRYSAIQAGVGRNASNQGWGPWEVNPARVLNRGQDVNGNPIEWQNIFTHPTWGRYGPNGVPDAVNPGQPGSVPGIQATAMTYNRFDLDAAKQAGTPSDNVTTQQPAALSSVSKFTTTAGYDSASAQEQTLHPRNYNPYGVVSSPTVTPDDRSFALINQKQLMASYGSSNTEAASSDVGQVIPQNVANPRIRSLLSLLSADVDRPGVTAHIYDPNDPNTRLKLSIVNPDPTNWYPTGTAVPFPSLATRMNAPPAGSEFAGVPNSPGDWRAATSLLGKLNLSVALSPFPAPDPNTGVIDITNATTLAQYQAALAERQNLARKIFDRLRSVTGAMDIAASASTDPTKVTIETGQPESAEYRANRWLAQLAVNLVDYIDPDNDMTPFNWYGSEYVFGTEMPRLVINEVYVQFDNDEPDIKNSTANPKVATKYNLNVWAELHNPLNSDAALTDGGAAVLKRGVGANAYSPYQLVISKTNTSIRMPQNTRGEPDNTPNQVFTTVNDFSAAPLTTVAPSNGAYSDPTQKNQGFYVLGPTTTWLAGENPGLPVTFNTPQMTVSLPTAGNGTPPRPSILLRKLANDRLPPNPDPTSPLYNPYITVDYAENVKSNDGREFDDTGARTPPAMNTRTAWGRLEPLGAQFRQWVNQGVPVPAPNPLPNVPLNTFFRHNALETNGPPSAATTGQTLRVPFTWLVHLDRPISSPLELLTVSAYKPHELTQQVVQGTRSAPSAHLHLAKWTQVDSRIARLLEFIETRDLFAGGSIGGRVLGRVNINTIFDPETLLALADPQPGNTFTAAQIYNPGNPTDPNTVWGKLLQSRSPGLTNLANPTITANDKPFKSLATGYSGASTQYPAGSSINDTILRQDPTNAAQKLFQVGTTTTHPYLQNELLRKLFNNVTTRSNVFAVWCTVGFFEVLDETKRPVELGGEIVVAGQQPVRPRFFAIVDRTNLTINPNPTLQNLQGPKPFFIAGETEVKVDTTANPAGPRTIQLPALTGSYNGATWSINVNDFLVADVGTQNEEVIQVTAIDIPNRKFTANFTKPHQEGFPLTNAFPGNPGPQPGFDYTDPRYSTTVVPYFIMLN